MLKRMFPLESCCFCASPRRAAARAANQVGPLNSRRDNGAPYKIRVRRSGTDAPGLRARLPRPRGSPREVDNRTAEPRRARARSAAARSRVRDCRLGLPRQRLGGRRGRPGHERPRDLLPRQRGAARPHDPLGLLARLNHHLQEHGAVRRHLRRRDSRLRRRRGRDAHLGQRLRRAARLRHGLRHALVLGHSRRRARRPRL